MIVGEEEVESIKDCPNLVSKYRAPKLLWYQTHNSVHLRILLPDVKKYRISVTPDTFKFITIVNDIPYFIGIRLCGTVVAEKTSHVVLGREVKVCFIKAHRWTDWPRLHLHKARNPLIVVDPDHIVKKLKSWDNPYVKDEERESYGDYKKRVGMTSIRPGGYCTESDSDSDDEKVRAYDE